MAIRRGNDVMSTILALDICGESSNSHLLERIDMINKKSKPASNFNAYNILSPFWQGYMYLISEILSVNSQRHCLSAAVSLQKKQA